MSAQGSHQGPDQEDFEQGGIRLFRSLAECEAHEVGEAVAVAVAHGFDTSRHEPTGGVLCGKHGTAELVEVCPDGTWQYRDETDEDSHVTRSGSGAQALGWYLEKTPDERREAQA